MSLSTAAFDWVRSVVEVDAAIVLEKGKEYLVESRLAPLARVAGTPDVSAFVEQLRLNGGRQARQQVVEAMTTNETSWFRDGSPYEVLTSSVLPELTAKRAAGRPLRIWSAACSTGQEPYTIAMLLQESVVRAGWRAQIVATDIDESVLARAKAGKYSQLEMNRGLPAAKLVQHFVRDGAGWRVNDDLKAMVQFTRLNLADPFPSIGPFDVVFLRNVLIYFSVETRRDILQRVRKLCQPDGYLVLGAAETTLGVDAQWNRVVKGRSAVYQPA